MTSKIPIHVPCEKITVSTQWQDVGSKKKKGKSETKKSIADLSELFKMW